MQPTPAPTSIRWGPDLAHYENIPIVDADDAEYELIMDLRCGLPVVSFTAIDRTGCRLRFKPQYLASCSSIDITSCGHDVGSIAEIASLAGA